MGYTTTFDGEFLLDKKLDDKTYNLLKALSQTRRVKRDISKLPGGFEQFGLENWGVEGEFYVLGGGEFGQAKEESIIDYNSSPRKQPGLWCQWAPDETGMYIEWDKGEKFYDYVEWLQYLIDNILLPRGYKLSGSVAWQGENPNDQGVITVDNGNVIIERCGYGIY